MKRTFKFLILLGSIFGIVSVLLACQPKEIGGYDYSVQGKNEESTLRIIGGWTKTGVGTHFHAGPDAGPGVMFALEGCMQYVRTSTKFYYLLAESFTHNDDSTSIIKIRDDAYWHDGNPVVAMDILSYYALNITDFGKYILDLEVIDANENGELDDDKELLVYWKPWKEPTNYSKNMLLAMDTKNGSIQYKTFQVFVDEALDLIYNGPDGNTPNPIVTSASDGQGEIRLGRHINSVSASLGNIYNQFRAFVIPGTQPGNYMATGPYKIQTVTENQMILVKNENYYFADQVGFDRIIATQYSNDNQIYADMKAGKLDYVDGVLPLDINESILVENRNLVSYKYYDQGAIGMYYNLEKEIWEDDLVREAFQYIFDRDIIRATVVPYGVTSYKPLMIMSPIEARQYMSSEAYSMINDYRFDQEKAAMLLEAAGWVIADNQWYDSSGKLVELTVGYQNIPTFLKVGQIVKASLENFGIKVILKSGSDWGTWFSIASSQNSSYDCVIAFTELNTFGTHPAGSMKHFFDILQAHVLHLPTDPNTGRFSIQVDLLSQSNKSQSLGRITVYSVYQNLYTYEGAELENYVDSIILGFSKYNYGIQFFENVTGSYFDASRVGGLPSPELMLENRNITVLPDYFEPNYPIFAQLNIHFTQAAPYGTGELFAKKSD